MIGTNTEETRIFIFEAWNTTVSPMLYAEALLATYGRNVLDILAMYPPNHPLDEREDLQLFIIWSFKNYILPATVHIIFWPI
jgi:hypothetical protein